ncbi:MAG: dihydropteridine reductase [Candidatus Coproplasma sp.]
MDNIQEKQYVEEIRRSYSEKSKRQNDFEELCRLDAKVKRPAEITAFTLGTVGSLVLGTGMCLAMQVLTTASFAMPLGIVIGLLGIAMVSVNYFIYKAILKSRKKKYGKQIVELSDSLLNN